MKHDAPYAAIDEGVDYRYWLPEEGRCWLWWACAVSSVQQ